MGENIEASDEEPDENIIEGGMNNFQKEYFLNKNNQKLRLFLKKKKPT